MFGLPFLEKGEVTLVSSQCTYIQGLDSGLGGLRCGLRQVG